MANALGKIYVAKPADAVSVPRAVAGAFTDRAG